MCGIFFASSTDVDHVDSIFSLLKNRGPHFFNAVQVDNNLFAASVLQTQGQELTEQPVTNEKGVMMFNGDLYMDLNDNIKSDTEWLFSQISQTSSSIELFHTIQKLKGPYSIVYYSKELNTIYFCRDSLGRKSLIITMLNGTLLISSVLGQRFKSSCEVPALGVFAYHLETRELSLYPWSSIDEDPFYTDILESFEKQLNLRVKVQFTDIERLHLLSTQKYKYNFEDLQAFKDMDDLNLMQKASILCKDATSTLLRILSKSVKDRVTIRRNNCKLCLTPCHHAKVAILFSGGLDCSIIAALAHQHIDIKEPIDLLNVSFEVEKAKPDIDWNVPDRISGLQTWEELKSLFPERKWNFIAINVKRDELAKTLNSHLRNVVYPLQSILDESLSAAFWFAARGKGILMPQGDVYSTPAHIVLLGSGADEIFGGYTRHKNVYTRNGIDALSVELEMDYKRLPYRNLGRDDRVISDNEVVARTPYIEEDFVEFTQSLAVNQKCFHSLRPGIGDKLLLRCSAFALNLRQCCFFRKRAVQFGSKVANRKQKADNVSSFLVDMD